jgi:hypothetical protein
MRKLILLALLVIPAFAQDAPKQPTPAELKLELAQANVQIAALTAQLHEAQFQLSLYDAAMGVAKRRADEQSAVQAAQKAVQDAQPKK